MCRKKQGPCYGLWPTISVMANFMEYLDCCITILFHPLPQTKTFAYETPIIYYQFAHHYFLCPDQLWTYRQHAVKSTMGIILSLISLGATITFAYLLPKLYQQPLTRVITDLTFKISNH